MIDKIMFLWLLGSMKLVATKPYRDDHYHPQEPSSLELWDNDFKSAITTCDEDESTWGGGCMTKCRGFCATGKIAHKTFSRDRTMKTVQGVSRKWVRVKASNTGWSSFSS
jgi:hypothetical protein